MPFAKCNCTACSGHIEFEASHAGQTVACPHCGLETILFIPPPRKENPLGEATARVKSSGRTADPAAAQRKPFALERLVFGITRVFVLALCVMAILGLVLLGVTFVLTLKLEKQERWVSYEEVSTALLPATPVSGKNVPPRPLLTAAVPIPQNILDEFFNKEHVLNGWLEDMNQTQQKQFLENLSEIIAKAKAAGADRSKLGTIMQKYTDLWNSKARKEEAREYVRLAARTAFVTSGFGLLLILSLLSMMLVLLAIERNTRPKA